MTTMRKNVEKRNVLGEGAICPRCLGRKPRGRAGRGIAFSRRGIAYICAACGTEEGMLDAGILSIEPHIAIRNKRLEDALAKVQSPLWGKP